MWYHVSSRFLGEKIKFVPSIPSISNCGQSELEGNIPRICVSSSIFQCLRARYGYNHITSISYEKYSENPCVYFTESVPLIPPACADFRNNDERWFLEPTLFYFLSRVDMYKLFTKQIIEPTDKTTIRLPKDVKSVFTAKENFLQKILDKGNS